MRSESSSLRASLRARVLIIIGVVAVAIWLVYPLSHSLKLGLDLNGGVQLVLRVKTDDALRAQTELAAERLRSALGTAGVSFTSVAVPGPTVLRVDGVADEAALRRAVAESAPAYAPTAGGASFELPAHVANGLRDELVEQARRTIDRRVNELGVAESEIARYTAADQILVQLPGVSDVEGAKRIIKSTSQLRLTLVDRGPFPSREAALASYGGSLPDGLELLPGQRAASGEPLVYAVQRVPAIAGSDLRSARQSTDEYQRPAVTFTLTAAAAKRFGAFTERNLQRPLATVLDGRVTSVATIQTRIDQQGQISGLSHAEMVEQVITLNSGALPADLEYVEERTVGASLGGASIRAGVLASLGGLGLVLLFMLGYYRRAGLNALASIVLNLLVLLAVMAWIPVTLTLPGIAGLILTIGMGVDSNVLIFERIKEDLAAGAAPRAAIRTAFTRVWLTIVDTHVTSLIAAAFLFQFGTTPIRGFATTLVIGLLANVFTAVFVSRTLFEAALRWQPLARTLSIGPAHLFPHPRVNFTRWRWHAMALSLLVAGAGLTSAAARGLPLGIDFASGTALVVQFPGTDVTEERIRAAVAPMPGDEVVRRYGAAADRRFQIRLPLTASTGDELDRTVRDVSQALRNGGLPDFTVQRRDLVSAAIGADLQRRGLYAVLASLGAITCYIGVRFRAAFAVGAIAATLHDVIVTLACLALARYDLSLDVVAALLTIIGYSVNDTIVIFDRVRENARLMRGASLDAVVNLSVNETLSRTVITAGTTFLSVLALYVFGGEALQGFAFAMLIGIVAGTYSTVFIASAIAVLLTDSRRPHLMRRERVEMPPVP